MYAWQCYFGYLRIPAVGVSLLYRQGYFQQKLDEWGGQQEFPERWSPDRFLRLLPETVQVEIEQRTVKVRAWQYDIVGLSRATHYKRADLIFSDIERLVEISKQVGSLQFVFAGKAHPKDYPGKELIRRIFEVSRQLRHQIPVVFLESYDLELARLIVSGVDLWLNTPQRPLEASGTSGMKAAHNGVPSFSILDGWWIEGNIEGVTGWAIGSKESELSGSEDLNRQDAEDMYQKLKNVIVPIFYRERERWIDVMRQAIALNASFFNTHRMVQQYVTNAYLP